MRHVHPIYFALMPATMAESMAPHLHDFTSLSRLRELDSPARRRENPTLSSPELSDLIRIISTVDEESQRYDNCIAQFPPLSVRLVKEQEELRQRVERARSLLAPIRTLPVDLLRQILILVSMTTASPDEIPTKSRPDSRISLSLGWICAQWRAVALATPIVWSSITTDLNPNIVEACIHRSGVHPLHVSIIDNTGRTSTRNASNLARLMQVSPRWQSARIRLNRGDLPTLNPLQNRLPLLRQLALEVFNPPVAAQPCVAFENAPMLSEITLEGMPPSALSHPTTQIRRLVLLNHFDKTCLSALSLTYQHLTAAVLCISPRRSSQPTLIRQTSMSARHLELTPSSYGGKLIFDGIDSVLSNLVAPSLESLSLSRRAQHHFATQWSAGDAFHGFLTHSCSATNLRSLVLALPMSTSSIMEILPRLPGLMSLTIDDDFRISRTLPRTVTDMFLRFMTLSSDGAGVLPNLEEFCLRLKPPTTPETFSLSVLTAMVRSRYALPTHGAASSSSLCRFEMSVTHKGRPFAEEVRRELGSWKGLTVCISTSIP